MCKPYRQWSDIADWDRKNPQCCSCALSQHKHLGVHTEVWSDALLPLIASGAIDNTQKAVHPGKIVSAFLIGSRKLYDFVHENPTVIQLDIAYINNPVVIAQNNKVAAINSAVEIDLTGQVCADSIGPRVISGIGGQNGFYARSVSFQRRKSDHCPS